MPAILEWRDNTSHVSVVEVAIDTCYEGSASGIRYFYVPHSYWYADDGTTLVSQSYHAPLLLPGDIAIVLAGKEVAALTSDVFSGAADSADRAVFVRVDKSTGRESLASDYVRPSALAVARTSSYEAGMRAVLDRNWVPVAMERRAIVDHFIDCIQRAREADK